jgi:hypothetical protein
MALVALVGTIPSLGVPGVAHAQRGDDDEPDDTTVAEQDADAARRAREQFEAGVRAFQARDFRAAIQAFQVAAELVPSADLWFNIARAHEELGEWEQSIDYYQRYLRDRVDPPDRSQVTAHIAELQERAEAARAARLSAATTGTLGIRVDVDGATVRLDDREIGRSPLSEELTLPPGRHELRVRRDGYLPFRSDVGVEPGLRTAAYVDLQPETRFRAITADRIFTWVAWGLGAVALGFTIGLGVEATSRQSTDITSAREWGSYSDYTLAAAIGLGAIGLVLWFVEGRAVGTETITTPEQPEVQADTGLREETAPAPEATP